MSKIVEFKCEINVESNQTQLLLYVDDENEINKFQIIRDICVDLNLLNKKHEIILTSFTNVAAANIDDNIYYMIFGISIIDRQQNTVSRRIRFF